MIKPMKLTDQEVKEAERAAGERCTGGIRNYYDPKCVECIAFIDGVTAALSSDKLLARVRAEAKREAFEEAKVNAPAILFKMLLDDPGYWMTWKANIAMAFQDEFKRSVDIHAISNSAAEYFLWLLTKKNREEEAKELGGAE